jgi:hypothetical protein
MQFDMGFNSRIRIYRLSSVYMLTIYIVGLCPFSLAVILFYGFHINHPQGGGTQVPIAHAQTASIDV